MRGFGHCQAGWYAAFFDIAQSEFPVAGQISLGELKHMNHLFTRPAAIKHFSVGRKFQPIKRLVQLLMRDYPSGLDIDDEDLMAAVSTMQHGGKAPGWIHGNIDGKIPQLDLFA